ncbi:MAG: type II toxin-antitoxin system VapC family toxin [Acidobacteria bacterium]|nr:type II toxin-antitoxin system VapC family toxin [Acidobacteriota bacterium]
MLLDTSGLLCLLHKDEPQHAETNRLYAQARKCLTHSYVLAELVPLGQVRGLPREQVLGFLRDLVRVPRVEVVWVSRTLHQQAMDLLEARRDKAYSLCDAVSFILMRERGFSEGLTTDKYFVQEGFIRLLEP